MCVTSNSVALDFSRCRCLLNQQILLATVIEKYGVEQHYTLKFYCYSGSTKRAQRGISFKAQTLLSLEPECFLCKLENLKRRYEGYNLTVHLCQLTYGTVSKLCEHEELHNVDRPSTQILTNTDDM